MVPGFDMHEGRDERGACTKGPAPLQCDRLLDRGRRSPHNGAGEERASRGDRTMLRTDTLTALFHDLVRGAMAAQQVESSETTQYSLVRLLEAFARPGRGDL